VEELEYFILSKQQHGHPQCQYHCIRVQCHLAPMNDTFLTSTNSLSH